MADASSKPGLNAWSIVGGIAGVAATAYYLVVRSKDATDAIARWVATAIFVGYTALMLTLFGAVVFGALRKDWSGPVMALVSNEKGTAVSLSRLQALLWTSLITFAWLYQLMLSPTEFPALPGQALVLMGISGATYLSAKSIDSRNSQADDTTKNGQAPGGTPPTPLPTPNKPGGKGGGPAEPEEKAA